MSNNSPTCPHCNYEFDEEETWYSDYKNSGKVYTGDGDESDLVCQNVDCGKEFKVSCYYEIKFQACDD